MAFNTDMYVMEKYQLKWLRVLYHIRGLKYKSYVCHLCVI